MTNLDKIYKYYNVHLHKEQEFIKDLLTNHLPGEYTSKVIQKLNEKKIVVKAGAIRNVKCGLQKNLEIFNGILDIALENKGLSESLKKTLQKAV